MVLKRRFVPLLRQYGHAGQDSTSAALIISMRERLLKSDLGETLSCATSTHDNIDSWAIEPKLVFLFRVLWASTLRKSSCGLFRRSERRGVASVSRNYS